MTIENLNLTIYYPIDLWFWITFAVVVWYVSMIFYMRRFHRKHSTPGDGGIIFAWLFTPVWVLPYTLYKILVSEEL